MLTLTPDDITAIAQELVGPLADAVAMRLRGDNTAPEPVDMAKAKRLMEIRRAGYEAGRASKGQGKNRSVEK